LEAFPTIAITMGDPAGIGPEIALQAALEVQVRSSCRPAIVGSLAVLENVSQALGIACSFRPVPAEGATNPSLPYNPAEPVIDVIDLANCRPGEFVVGQISPICGKAAAEYIETAVRLALGGKAEAIVTGPIHKEAIHLAGVGAPGHTEMLAQLTGVKDYAMMLVAGGLRVSHVTTHIALKEVPQRITCERVYTVIRLTHDGLAAMGISAPRIAVAGLNPHSGEGGLFGLEDRDEILPAVRRAQRDGLHVAGPVPADTVFVRALAGEYDAVVAMYHDQGHIPVKLLGFKAHEGRGAKTVVSGVNVTLGLPIIRTSVDHGVAFDIAGKGVASWQSMVDAIHLAVEMSRHKTR